MNNKEIQSNQKIIKIAQEFIRLGRIYPHSNTSFVKFLEKRKAAYKDYINGTKKTSYTWYPSDIEVAKAHGLPDDWMLLVDLEKKSNQKVIELGHYFVKHGYYPRNNTSLGRFLQTRKQTYKNYTNNTKTNQIWYPSDIEIAKAYGLPDDWMLLIDFEKESNQKVIELADYLVKYGTYPDWNTALGFFLEKRKAAYKDYINGTKKTSYTWYPSDIEVAKAHGLPDDWMLLVDLEKKSNQKVIELGHYFVKHGYYPRNNTSLGRFLQTRKQTYKNYTNNTKTNQIWYPSDIEIAKAYGLPDDWMLLIDFEKESNQKVIELADYLVKYGTYPDWNTALGFFLSKKRRAYKDYIDGTEKTSCTWYISDIEVAKAHGLPDDWMLLIDFEIQSNQKVIELGHYFTKHGTYPDQSISLGKFLARRRRAYKDYVNGIKSKLTWCPSDIQIAKAYGLPDDWILRQKAESLGEKRTKFILENFNIKPMSQYRHKLCFNKLCLPFDFYFNKNKLNYFIEYNGIQHYQPIYGKTQIIKEETFKRIQKNDLIKLNFCKKNNYPLLVIPYWIKDFENLISEFLKTTQFDPNFAQPIIPNLPELN